MTSERIFVALDLETTGLDANRDTIIEIGAVKFQGDVVLDRFETLVNPRRPIPVKIQQITGIDDSDVADAPLFGEVVPELIAFVGNETSGIVAHNASFDLGFMRSHGVDFRRPGFDTLELAALLLPRQASYSLGELSHNLQIVLKEAHRALDDAEATAHLFMALMQRLEELPVEMLVAIVSSGAETDWSPLRLFADRLDRAGIDPALARKSLGAMVSPQARARAAAIFANALPEEEGDYRTVPVERLEAAFAVDGALGRLMGARYEERTGQVEMARRVLDSFNRGDHLMVEAGTGTGKSLAYLLPAALWAAANRRRVVVATNTLALQDQLLEKEIPQVRAILQAQDEAPVRGALLKGRRNYLCLRRLHEWRSSHSLSPQELSVLARVLVWLPTTETGDVAELALPTPADREIWGQICSDGATCSEERCGAHVEPGLRDFYMLARREAEAAHIVVVNHALLFADIAADGNVLPNASHLIIDEAHHLEEAATEQLTWRIEFGSVQAQLRQIMEAGDLARSLMATAGRIDFSEAGRLIRSLDVQARETSDALRLFHHVLLNFATHYIPGKGEAGRGERGGESSRGETSRGETSRGERGEGNFAQRQTIDGSARSQPLWSEVEIEWENAAESLQRCSDGCEALLMAAEREAWTEVDANRSALGQLRALHGDLSDLHEHLEEIVYGSRAGSGGHGGRVCWIELNEYRSIVSLLAAPLQVSELVQSELIHRLRTVILTGATLRTGATFRYVRERLGLWDVPTAIVDSPFDYPNSVLLFMPSDLAQPNSPAWQPGVEQAIVTAAQACKGRTLVLFTSNAHLRTTADAVRAPLEKLGISVLQQGATSRHKLLRDFRAASEAVLMGTRTYWEGIDLPGDELRCLLIAKLPFAVPNDPLVAARSAECEDSFADYMLPDAVLRFRQGFGRLIRRASDRGVVVLLDSRVWRKEYGQIFLDALPQCTTRNAPLSILGSEVKQWLSK